jgi:hypothetical protein
MISHKSLKDNHKDNKSKDDNVKAIYFTFLIYFFYRLDLLGL